MNGSNDSAPGGTYGARLNAPAIVELVSHVFDANLAAARFGELPTPICLWGPHGIGKTALIRGLAKQRGWHFVEVAPAQIEELGDLHGLPTRIDTGSGAAKDGRTAFLPPEWVPREEGPGVLLLDDLNRADERVLRALMQLLQNHRLYSWALPKGWQIVCTANPESGEYNVTSMDEALITRMLHFTLAFDATAWLAWARGAGIDPRCMEFVQRYPEAALGKRTTPRTLVQFFRQVAIIEDFASRRDLVSSLAQATLDEATASVFVRFACDDVRALPSALDVLDAPLPQIALDVLHNAARDAREPKRLRVDRLGLVIARLEAFIERDDYTRGSNHACNLKAVLLDEAVPRDLAMRLHRTLSKKNLGALVRDRAVAKRLMTDIPL